MNYLKMILGIGMISFVLGNCSSDDSNDDEAILGLALLTQSGGVNIPFLESGEIGAYVGGPYGKAENKFNINEFGRGSAAEVTVTITNVDTDLSYAKIFFNVEPDLTNGRSSVALKDRVHFIRLDASGIRGYGKTDSVGGDEKGTRNQFLLVPGTSRTFCLESHREVKDGAGGYPSTDATMVAQGAQDFHKIEAHHIAWNKPCSELTATDKSIYQWDSEVEIESSSTESYKGTWQDLSRWNLGKGIGFVTKNAVVSVRALAEPVGTAGNIR